MQRPKPIYAVDVTRTQNGKPIIKRFTELGWKLMAGDDNLKAGRWKKIQAPKAVQAARLEPKQPKQPKPNATRAAVDLADEKGINIFNVEGSGDGGRITKSDVEQHLIDASEEE